MAVNYKCPTVIASWMEAAPKGHTLARTVMNTCVKIGAAVALA